MAVTDPMQLIASGLGTVNTGNLLASLKDYLRTEEVTAIVLGEPRQMNNSPSEIESDIQAFIGKLKEAFPEIPVYRQDERFTSKMAVRSMVEGGLKKKKRRDKALVDEISATLILQAFLNRKEI